MVQRPVVGGRRWRVAALFAVLSVPGIAQAAPTGTAAEIQSLFARGQDEFSREDYERAAATFTDVLGRVEEVLPNRATRENVMLNVLASYEWAYRRSGDAAVKQVDLLDEGQQVLDTYIAELGRVYGAKAQPSPEAAEKIAQYQQARQVAHSRHGGGGESGPSQRPADGSDRAAGPPATSPPAQARGCGQGAGGRDMAWLGAFVFVALGRRRP
jgi:hypothetical protein